MIRYVAMNLQKWDKMEALTPMPQKVAGCGKSVGCLLVYDSVAALLSDHPNSQYVEVQPVTGGKSDAKKSQTSTTRKSKSARR